MDLTRYTDNQLTAIQDFARSLHYLLGPIWIQNFLDDLQIAVNKEWVRRDN